MLNYIWTALLIVGIGAALFTDISDEINNRYGNGKPVEIYLEFEESFTSGETQKITAEIRITKNEFEKIYKEPELNDIEQKSRIIFNPEEESHFIEIFADEKTPAVWKKIAVANGEEENLEGSIILTQIDSSNARGILTLEPVFFPGIKKVTNAALEYAGIAVNIALGLIGIMALWLGIMKIADKSGLVKIIAKIVKPLTKFLFPEVPPDHPAISAIVMNMSANMLGLGNAATPFGLKAMEDLNKLNPDKNSATNAMCTFLAINTAGLTIIPATAIAVRAASGSSNPAIIIGTSIFGALCATITGLTAAKIFEKFSVKGKSFLDSIKDSKNILIFLAVVVLFLILAASTGIKNTFSDLLGFLDAAAIKNIITIISSLAIPVIIFGFVLYGIVKKIKVYEVFVEGAKEGFEVAVRIIPFLVAMLVAIGIFRAGGGIDFLITLLNPLTELIGMPPEALPMALMRPLSGSGSLGIMTEIISQHGPDSFIGILASTFFGSTETTFYVLAVYFGAVNIRKTRHALAAGLLADIAGILGALFIVKQMFG